MPVGSAAVDNAQQHARGPASYENWRNFLDSLPLRGTFEVPFYTDARITGEIHHERTPYSLLNTVPVEDGYSLLRPAIVLRYQIHFPAQMVISMQATDTSSYHGGGLADEVAALVSLCLGVRCKAGPVNRRFDEWDPKGRPIAHDPSPIPTLITSSGRPRLPWAIGSHPLGDAELFATLPNLAPEEAGSLVKAARAYQNAAWIAEAEPEMAWLFLVSAIETAAERWSQDVESPINVFRRSYSDLVDMLQGACEEGVIERGARRLAPLVGATQKFVRFVLRFVPAPPSARPPEFAQLDWSHASLERAVRLVYEHRSCARHGGTPYPAPMCEKPGEEDTWAAPIEVPPGLATSARGGTWLHSDTPMLLHTFEYLVRGALLKWWASMNGGVAGPA